MLPDLTSDPTLATVGIHRRLAGGSCSVMFFVFFSHLIRGVYA